MSTLFAYNSGIKSCNLSQCVQKPSVAIFNSNAVHLSVNNLKYLISLSLVSSLASSVSVESTSMLDFTLVATLVWINALTLRVAIPLFIAVIFSSSSSDQMSCIFWGLMGAWRCWSGILDTWDTVWVLSSWCTTLKLLVDVVTVVCSYVGDACSSNDDNDTSCICSGVFACSCAQMSFRALCLLDTCICANCSSAVPPSWNTVFWWVAHILDRCKCIFWNLNILSVISLFVPSRPGFSFYFPTTCTSFLIYIWDMSTIPPFMSKLSVSERGRWPVRICNVYFILFHLLWYWYVHQLWNLGFLFCCSRERCWRCIKERSLILFGGTWLWINVLISKCHYG